MREAESGQGAYLFGGQRGKSDEVGFTHLVCVLNAGVCRSRRLAFGCVYGLDGGRSQVLVSAGVCSPTAGVRGCWLAPAFLVFDGWLRGCSLAPVTGIKRGGGSSLRWVLTRGFVVLDGWLRRRSLAPVTETKGGVLTSQLWVISLTGPFRFRQLAVAGFIPWRSRALVRRVMWHSMGRGGAYSPRLRPNADAWALVVLNGWRLWVLTRAIVGDHWGWAPMRAGGGVVGSSLGFRCCCCRRRGWAPTGAVLSLPLLSFRRPRRRGRGGRWATGAGRLSSRRTRRCCWYPAAAFVIPPVLSLSRRRCR